MAWAKDVSPLNLEVTVERNGVLVGAGSLVKPGELIRVVVQGASFYSSGTIHIRVTDASGAVFLERDNTAYFSHDVTWEDFVAPTKEGSYRVEATTSAFIFFGTIKGETSFTVSRNATEPPSKPGFFSDIKKAALIGGGLLLLAALVMNRSKVQTIYKAVKSKVGSRED